MSRTEGSAGPVFVAGHRGLVGAAIVRQLESAGSNDLLLAGRDTLDLRDAKATRAFLLEHRPACVYVAAARVGGIAANNEYPADFIADNLAIQSSLIDGSYRAGVRKLVFLGSSCIYPKHAPQPMTEEALLTGPLEPTNQPYAIAKIAGIEMCLAYRRQYGFDAISLMPTNLYGPGDNFHPEHSHVLPSLIRRFHEAARNRQAEVTVWGTGSPRREFLYVDDLARAAVFAREHYSQDNHLNVGTGTDVTIAELAAIVKDVVGYPGRIVFDSSRPDGTPRKLLDVSRLSTLGWHPLVTLREGIERTYRWYCEQAEVRQT